MYPNNSDSRLDDIIDRLNNGDVVTVPNSEPNMNESTELPDGVEIRNHPFTPDTKPEDLTLFEAPDNDLEDLITNPNHRGKLDTLVEDIQKNEGEEDIPISDEDFKRGLQTYQRQLTLELADNYKERDVYIKDGLEGVPMYMRLVVEEQELTSILGVISDLLNRLNILSNTRIGMTYKTKGRNNNEI